MAKNAATASATVTSSLSRGTWWKWLGFVTAVWVQCVSGNNYTFSNYSDALKSLMGLTQLQLNNLSVAKDVGKAFGLLAGLASDRLPMPAILLIGSLEGLIGYGAQWLVVRRAIAPLPYWQMCVFLCMGGNSSTWMNTAVLVTCIRNFRRNRGPVSGILKGYVGLSTAIFTDISAALFPDNPAAFLLLLAIAPAAICAAAMLFLRDFPPADGDSGRDEEEEEEGRCFAAINTIAVVIAVYLLAFDLAPGVVRGAGVAAISAFVAVLFLLLAAPAAVPVYVAVKARIARNSKLDLEERSEPLLHAEEEEEEVEKEKEEVVAVAGDEAVVLAVAAAAAAAAAAAEAEAEGKRRGPRIGDEHTIAEALSTTDFWVLFISFLCGVGTGLTVMNNMGQIGAAMGYADVSVFISLISIWGFFGRIGSGTLSEYFLKKNAIPRPLWNAASQILMAVGYVVMALALPGSLYIGSVIVGVCYGFRLAITVPAASELFGLKYYGLIYNILILNLPLGSFLFSGLLAGLLYDAEATKTAGGGNTCVGAHCYRLVFFVMAFACLVGFGLDVLLTVRTKKVYLRIHMNKNSKRSAAAAAAAAAGDQTVKS
ncbi:protein NUCLEAR FUSION DEFECTIVE 4-like isoform X2 [Ananas comosus]|uniref:Protein NUCLEAR FUSION DEFECTIVE 4-like isoform X2 n=1 Tax=Ananas comosus TaxID=4615 RepID=A0A6P5H7R3_ANACO|nr:protein NUCLEAR FUSION DEFECTIVE 4-like isoform X2 [Ananas comosus]